MQKISLPWLCVFLLCFTTPAVCQKDWTPLFNGKNLKGWKQVNGTATYVVRDGILTGSAVVASPNSFLCTVKNYEDFILEFEVRVDPTLNSGVQIRSHCANNEPNGRVYGYQVEIDPSERAWSAGIYDESRRGWLYPLNENMAAQRAFDPKGWNKYHVEAIGHVIRTWINGIPASNLTDDLDSTGFIGLQVHGIGNDATKAGLSVSWRNIRILTSDLANQAWKMPEEVVEISTIPNTLTGKESANGWKLLWDGKSLSGWRSPGKAGFPDKGWTVIDRCLVVNPEGSANPGGGGDIITTTGYSDFDLQLDFMLDKGANSGIKYFVMENKDAGAAIGLEYQLLDDANHADAKNGVGGNRTCGSLYDLIPPLPERIVHPVGEWNHARIVCQGNHVEHWLNGIRIVEYDRGNQLFKALVQKSKYAAYAGFGESAAGPILLQDHGDRVSFRNIKIKTLIQ